TAVAVVADGHDVRSNLIASQHDLHARYGGVVPELASRAHIERLDLMGGEGMMQADASPGQLGAISGNGRPGLVGARRIGVAAAKTLAWAWGKPLVDVNHIHAHAVSAAIEKGGVRGEPRWPAVALVVSGGHTSLFLVRKPVDIVLLGRTIDDAAGEA